MKTTLAANNGNENNGRGRGLSSMASALTSAGVEGLQAQIDRDAIAQDEKDRAQVERQARALNRARKACGCASEWQADAVGGGGWSAAMEDAKAEGLLALRLWRSRLCLERDTATGEDVLTAARGEALTVEKVSWQALQRSLTADGWGETLQRMAAAWDWSLWYYGDKFSRDTETPAQRQARRESQAGEIWAAVGKRPGRSKQLAAKGLKATLLMVAGVAADEACLEAGFKGHAAYKGTRGAVSPAHRFAAALRRAGKHVVSLRGRWAQDMEDCAQAVYQAQSARWHGAAD